MTRASARGAAGWTAALLLGVYVLTTGGPLVSDGEVMLLTAISLVDRRTIALGQDAAAYDQTVTRPDGEVFSRYGLGQPLVAAPLYGAGRYVVGRLLRVRDEYAFGRFFALLLPAIATASTAGLLAGWAAHLYRSAGMGIALGLLYGTATLAWPYSRFFFSEPLFGCFLMAAACALYAGRPLAGGVALGLAVATRVGGAALLPAYALYLLLREWGWERRIRALAAMAAGLVPGALLVLLNNWIRFGGPVERGYGDQGFTGNVLIGLYGLLLSPGKSVFLYAPVLLALPSAVVAFRRRFPEEALLIAALSAITLGQSALWWAWWGGWSWGPRFLVPLMPFAVLPLGVLLRRGSWRWVIGGGLLPLSLCVNALGILVDFNEYFIELGADERRAFFEPGFSPILEHLRRVNTNQWWVARGSTG